MRNAPQVSLSAEAKPKGKLRRLWKKFDEKFPNDELSLKEIVARLIAEGALDCGVCEVPQLTAVPPRSVCCSGCSNEFSATAGTFFEHMRTPRAWLAAIWLFERRMLLNAMDLHRLLGIAPSSARAIILRITAVIAPAMRNDTNTAPSSSFVPLFCKRSRATGANEHPRSEESISEIEAPVLEEPPATEPPEADQSEPEEISEAERLLLEVLIDDTKQFDEICEGSGLAPSEVQVALTMLELADRCIRIGSGYCRKDRRSKKKSNDLLLTPEQIKQIDKAIDFIQFTYQGISRRYLQLYLAAHWCFESRKRWGIGKVFGACARFGKVTSAEINSQLSLQFVNVAS